MLFRSGRLLKVVRVTRTHNNGFEGIVLECELSNGARIRVSSTSNNLKGQFRNIADGAVSPPIVGRAVLTPATKEGQQATHSLE